VRTSGGTITTFEGQGAGTLIGQGTAGYGINTAGTVTGTYVDGSYVFYGYFRTP